MIIILVIIYILGATLTYGLTRGTDLKEFPTVHFKWDVPFALVVALLFPIGLISFWIHVLIAGNRKYVSIRFKQ